MNKNSVLTKWLPVFLWATVIFSFSSVPQIKVTDFFLWDFIFKKTAHVLEYAVLFVLLYRATNKKWFWSFAITLLYAVSDEYHQSFVVGRSSTFYDLGFDLSGANIASYIIWKLKQIRPEKPKK